jgi:hypothetical protein
MSEPADEHVAESSLLPGVVRRSARRVYALAVIIVLIGVVLGVGATVLAYRAAQDRKDDKDRGPDVAAQDRKDDKDRGPDVYANLRLPRERGGILFPERPLTDAVFDGFRQAQVSHLKGQPVLHAALRDPKVKDLPQQPWGKVEPVAWLEEHLRVDFPEGPEVMRVGLDGDNPKALKALVNAVVDAYLKDREDELRADRLDKLKAIQTKYAETVGRLHKNWEELAQVFGAPEATFIATIQSILERQLREARSELIKVTAELRRLELEAQLYQPQARDGAPPPAGVIDRVADAYVDKDLEIDIAAKKKLEKLLAKAQEETSDPDNGRIKQLRKEIEDKEIAIKDRREELRQRHKAQLQDKAQNDAAYQAALLDKFNDAAFQAALLDKQIKFNREYKKLLEGEIQKLNKSSTQLVNGVMRLDFDFNLDDGKRELRQAEAGLNLVSAEIDKATVEPPAGNRVQRLDKEAVVNPKKK